MRLSSLFNNKHDQKIFFSQTRWQFSSLHKYTVAPSSPRLHCRHYFTSAGGIWAVPFSRQAHVQSVYNICLLLPLVKVWVTKVFRRLTHSTNFLKCKSFTWSYFKQYLTLKLLSQGLFHVKSIRPIKVSNTAIITGLRSDLPYTIYNPT